MRVLILTQFYPPESGAPQNRLSDLARRLSEAGHDVEVLTAMPNYPRGVVFDGYRRRAVLEERREGIRVVRTWIFAADGGFVKRVLAYWSFMVSSVLFGLGRIGRPDALIVELPPLFLGISGYLMSRLLRARLVLNVSDLWPESAVAMGILRNRLLIRLSRGLEEFLYARADLITGQTEGIVKNIQSRFPTKRVALVTNGVDLSSFPGPPPSERRQAVRREFGLAESFVVGYAGLHGHAQGLETVVGAARLLEKKREFVFAFFGEGPRKEELAASARDLTSVRFLAAQPSSRMYEILSAFDVALIPLRRLHLFRGALPSKIFEAMAAGLPLVVSVEGEARDLVERSEAGVCVEPENPQALADALLMLRADRELRRRMGENGRRYVAAHYDRALIGDRFESLLRETVSGERFDPLEDRHPAGGQAPLQEHDPGHSVPESRAKTGNS